MIKEFYISTENRYQLIDITDRVEGVVRESKELSSESNRQIKTETSKFIEIFTL